MLLTSLGFFVFLQTASVLGEQQTPCDGVEIVWRKDWKARPSVRSRTVKLPLLHVIIQHTVSPPCKTRSQCIRNVQFIQDYHLDYKGWGDIAYNFLIGGDGRAYEGIGWNHEGAHSINFNWKSLGIAFIGNFMEVTPSQKMLDAALNLIKCGVKEGYLAPTYELTGHRDVACTLSPGDKLYEIIRQWDNYKGGRLDSYDCSGN
ncbi:peptidoglycan recognition protein 1-like [Argiope bruennichi]|uniref:peptidoglycan recognition protein 1-like n=1 Tax=Argiope bruennichi TaxID=94029 RepID=UPI00249588BE|nr:peptidoglycan recognition protein 1-like [Argiope bruennichi]XP_055925287.1 peptidoglycan recognition protein 1-like [Argiope bruennichi]